MVVVTPSARAGARSVGDPGSLTAPHRIVLWLTGAWTAGGVILWLCFPLLAPGLLLLCAVTPLAWCWTVEGRLPWFLPSPATVVLMLATGYLLINAVWWSPSRETALHAVAYLALMLGVLHVVPRTLPRLDPRVLVTLAAGFIVALVIGGALVAVEVLSEQALQRLLLDYLPFLQPFLQPDALEIWGQNGLNAYSINKNVCVLTLLLCPAALLAHRLALRDGHRLALLAALAFSTITILASSNDTSKVALAAGIAIFGVFRLRPALARRLVLTGWVLLNLCVVPAALLLYSADLHRSTWLPESWRHRVVIWRHTAEQVAGAPVLGTGMDAARAAHAQEDAHRAPVPGTRFTLSTNLHSHNGYLQIWYDAGAAGALLCLAFGLLVLREVGKVPLETQPYLLAHFTAAAAMAAFSYSIWAYWFMASLAMSGIFATLAAVVPDAPRRTRAQWTPTFASLVSAAATTVLISSALQSFAPSQRIALEPRAIRPEAGVAYLTQVSAFGGLLQPVPAEWASAERGSELTLLEDGTKAGPPASLHQDIREKGMGRYALNGSHLYFSATDNSDPRTNGRRYVVVVPMGLSPGAAWWAGLLGGLILLAGWSTIAPPVAAVAAAAGAGLTRFLSSASARALRILTVVALAASRLVRYRPGVPALAVCATFGTAVAIGVQALWLPQRIDVESTAIVAERGHAYAVDIAPPTDLLRPGLGDQESGRPGSPLKLLEDGREIGPAHAPHDDIRAKGAGRYSHWGAKLYLSASDNSNPRSNGRRYVVIVPMGVSPGAAWWAGLLGGLILLAGWSTVAAVAAAAAYGLSRFGSSVSALWSRILAVAALSALRLVRYRPGVPALVVCAAFATAVAIGVQALWLPQRIHLAPAAIAAEVGHGYTVDIAPPNGLLHLGPSDQESGGHSSTLLLENGRTAGPAHAPHDDIRAKGAGRYSHWGAKLYLSATDNSDPRTNGRRYVVVVPMGLSPGVAWVAGLLGGLILLAGWSTVAPPVSAVAAAAVAGLKRFGARATALSSRALAVVALTALRLVRFRPGVPALVASAAFGTMLAVGVQALWVPQCIDVQSAAIAAEQGHAYTVDIAPPNDFLRIGPSDRESTRPGSGLRLLEDGREIGPAHAPHGDIRANGAGRYSHWGALLYLSATDNSDPRSNGRQYVVVVPMGVSPSVAWVAGLLGGLMLLAGWSTITARVSAVAAAAVAGLKRFGARATALSSRALAVVALTAWRLVRFRPGVPALVASAAFGTMVAVGVQALGLPQRIELTSNAIVPEQGAAYTVDIAPPTGLLRLGPSDRESGGRSSGLRLLEDGREIGPAHAPHDHIRVKGAGRYSHWGAQLYLSATDNSDPRSNGRHYVVVVPITLSPAAAWGAGLLSGAILLAGWGFRRGRKRAAAGCGDS